MIQPRPKLIMDILRFYNSHPRSPQVQEESLKLYSQLREGRISAAKLVVPAALLIAVTSIRKRPFIQICRNFVIMTLGGMTINETLAWNSLTGKLYLLMQAGNDNE